MFTTETRRRPRPQSRVPRDEAQRRKVTRKETHHRDTEDTEKTPNYKHLSHRSGREVSREQDKVHDNCESHFGRHSRGNAWALT